MRLSSTLLVGGILGLAGLSGCGTSVKPGQMGVKYLSLGTGLQKDVKPNGFYFQWAWNDIVKYDVTWQTKTESVEILTADDLHISTQVRVTYRPSAAEIYRLATEIGPDYYDAVIRPSFITIARSEFAKHEHNRLAKEGPAIEGAALNLLRQAVAGKPIEIDRVTISHIEYDRTVTQAIAQKVATEQRLEQKDFELKIAARDADIARTSARGRADAQRLEAEGEAAAIVLRGNAQAQAQSEIAKTLTASYLRYKAFDSDSTRYYFVPTGKDGMPLIINTEPGPSPMAQRERRVARRP